MYKTNIEKKEENDERTILFTDVVTKRDKIQNDTSSSVDENCKDDYFMRFIQHPVVADEDVLIDKIINALPDVEADVPQASSVPLHHAETKTADQPPRFIFWLRVTSSVAAMLLIGLFIQLNQVATPQVCVENTKAEKYLENEGRAYSSCSNVKERYTKYIEIKKSRKNMLSKYL